MQKIALFRLKSLFFVSFCKTITLQNAPPSVSASLPPAAAAQAACTLRMSAQRAAHRRQKKGSDIHSQKQPLRPLYVATLTPLTEHFPSLFPDVRQGNAISRMEQFTTMDTRSGNTATAASRLTERPSPSIFRNKAVCRILLIKIFFYRICNITPTPLFQLKHYRYSNSNIHDTITHIKHRKRFPRNPSITPPCIPL